MRSGTPFFAASRPELKRSPAVENCIAHCVKILCVERKNYLRTKEKFCAHSVKILTAYNFYFCGQK
jgi:hypothetical protein